MNMLVNYSMMLDVDVKRFCTFGGTRSRLNSPHSTVSFTDAHAGSSHHNNKRQTTSSEFEVEPFTQPWTLTGRSLLLSCLRADKATASQEGYLSCEISELFKLCPEILTLEIMSEKISKPPPVAQVAYSTSTGGSATQPVPSKETPPHNSNRNTSNKADTTNNSDDESMIESWDPEVGGIYAPLLRVQAQSRVENSATVPLPRRTIGGLRDQVEQLRVCHCQKSNCLKV